MLFDRWRVRTIRRVRAVTIEAQNVGRLPQERIVLRAMHVMATEAGDAARVHEAGHEVVLINGANARPNLVIYRSDHEKI
jgi:hypothetical protein